MTYTTKVFFALFITLIFTCCERITDRGQKFAEKVTKKFDDTSDKLVDKVIPHFDSDKPDTRFNKQRFTEFLQVEITPDVRNIYCFDDAIGIDASFQFSFNCGISTVRRIIQKHNLTLDTTSTDYAFGLQSNFEWWDKSKIEILRLYSWKGEHEYYKYFWYDDVEKKAYYFEFDR